MFFKKVPSYKFIDKPHCQCESPNHKYGDGFTCFEHNNDWKNAIPMRKT